MDTQEHFLQEIESQWPAHIRHGLAELIRRNPDEQFYAAAFWLFYCDYTVIAPPTFGANTESMRWKMKKRVNGAIDGGPPNGTGTYYKRWTTG
jgi:hypothetical protein